MDTFVAGVVVGIALCIVALLLIAIGVNIGKDEAKKDRG